MPRNNALRCWYKPWSWSTRTWAIAIVLAFLCSPVVTRWISRWRIPDVVLPFDVEDVIRDDIPDDQNAFTVYADVMKLLKGSAVVTGNAANPADPSKPEPTTEQILQRLFGHDEQALAEYIRAGKMEQSRGPSLKTMTFWTNLSFHKRIRGLVRHYSEVGKALDDSGDTEKAWTCHLANL